MANKDDYLTYYRKFFEDFAQTVNPHDQLPVKLASYKLISLEVIGGVIDWTTQYLTQKKCPPNLLAPLIQIIIEETRKACRKQPILCGFNPKDNAYEPLKLMQTVMAKTNEVCLRYLDNSMLCSLPAPNYNCNITSVYAVRNKRRTMEDRHVVIHDLNTMFNKQGASPSSYYAVFDGHAGHVAAAYSAAHLHQFLCESENYISNPEQALVDAFKRTDALFVEKCQVESLSSGTTAVCALHRPKEKTLYVAWAGDSQALLVKKGRIFQCVQPHKPCRQDERERIEAEGGQVMYWGMWRVNGQLAVSRAIGDADYKPYVTAVPDIEEVTLDGEEDFLILACDGLWDHLSEEDTATTVYNMICKNPDNTDSISEKLVELSKKRGSTDNITVIVVFLREPSKIAADAHWANRNGSPITMDTSLDNTNNPFAISNGGATNQKNDGLLLNLTENFKKNGQDLSPAGEFFHNNETNGKRSAFEDDDGYLGPETDVDGDWIPPSSNFNDTNKKDGGFNPFEMEKMDEGLEKAALEIDLDLQKQQTSEFDAQRSPREETPTPPADAVHDGGLEDNVADSGEDSEDEWNYITGEEANKENIEPSSAPTSQPDAEVAELTEDPDNMSQLNPNAAEFVPISPTRSIPSPACRSLINDPVLAQSPRRPTDMEIQLPKPEDFESEVKSRPSDVDVYTNGHKNADDQKQSCADELMENLLNGKNIDEIPEFQPSSNSPTKVPSSEEFHFGPNATPFTPAKLMDQSDFFSSTKAVFGDETIATIESISLNDTKQEEKQEGECEKLTSELKNQDPMSASFYQDKDEDDLDKVHVIPDNLEDFLKESKEQKVQTTDLDEKELASPLEPSEDLESSGLPGLSEPFVTAEPFNLSDSLEAPELLKPSEPSKPSESPELSEFLKSSEFSKPSESLKPSELSKPESLKPFEPFGTETVETLLDLSALKVLEENVQIIEDSLELEEKEEVPEAAILRSEEVKEISEVVVSDKLDEKHEDLLCDLSHDDDDDKISKEESLESQNEITSSVKDAASPISPSSPIPDETVKNVPLETSTPSLNQQQENDLKLDRIDTEEVDFVLDNNSKVDSTLDSVKSDEVRSFLAAEEVTSPLSPLISLQPDLQQSAPKDHNEEFEINLEEPLMKCVFPLPQTVKDEIPSLGVEVEVKTDNIVPEFAESTIVPKIEPLQEIHVTNEEKVLVPDVELKEVKAVQDEAKAATVEVKATSDKIKVKAEKADDSKPKDKTKVDEKKTKQAIKKAPLPSSGLAAKKPGPLKSSPLLKPKTAPITKPSPAAPKSTLKTSTSSPATTAAAAASKSPKPAVPRPRTAPTIPSSASGTSKSLADSKKPLTNGDIKKPATLTVKRSAESTVTKRTVSATATTKPATTTSATKLSPTKPRPTKSGPGAIGGTATAAGTTTSASNGAVPKTRPITLKSSTVGARTSAKPLNAKPQTLSPTKSSPSASAPRPRPTTASSTGGIGAAAARPRLGSARSAPKTSADTEKQIKESANKLTALKSTKSTTAVKKTELTASKTRTVTKTTSSTTSTTANRTTGGKKPIEITRNLTKTTKIEKPQQNGVTTVVTEQITTVNTVVNNAVDDVVNNGDPQLLKDNSPIDNKLITETAND